MFQTKVVEKIKTNILCSINVFRKSWRLWDKVEKYGRAGWTTSQYNTAQTRCMLDKYAYRHTHTHTHTLKMCNNFCFSTLTRTRLNITFIPTLPVLSLLMPSCRAERRPVFMSILKPNDVIGLQIIAWLLSCNQFGGDSKSADVINVARCTYYWLLSVDLSVSLLTKHINLLNKHEAYADLNHYFVYVKSLIPYFYTLSLTFSSYHVS